MGIGVSIFLLALGAILAFAVDFNSSGIDINTVGVILMIVGVVGVVTSMVLWDRLGLGAGYGRGRTVVRHDVVDEPVATRRVVRSRRVVRDEEIL